jgi:hypothetical protein
MAKTKVGATTFDLSTLELEQWHWQYKAPRHSALWHSVDLFAKRSINGTQHNGTQYSSIECHHAWCLVFIFILSVNMLLCRMSLCWMSSECRYAECRYADCHYAECRGAQNKPKGILYTSAPLRLLWLNLYQGTLTERECLVHLISSLR